MYALGCLKCVVSVEVGGEMVDVFGESVKESGVVNEVCGEAVEVCGEVVDILNKSKWDFLVNPLRNNFKSS